MQSTWTSRACPRRQCFASEFHTYTFSSNSVLVYCQFNVKQRPSRFTQCLHRYEPFRSISKFGEPKSSPAERRLETAPCTSRRHSRGIRTYPFNSHPAFFRNTYSSSTSCDDNNCPLPLPTLVQKRTSSGIVAKPRAEVAVDMCRTIIPLWSTCTLKCFLSALGSIPVLIYHDKGERDSPRASYVQHACPPVCCRLIQTT